MNRHRRQLDACIMYNVIGLFQSTPGLRGLNRHMHIFSYPSAKELPRPYLRSRVYMYWQFDIVIPIHSYERAGDRKECYGFERDKVE